MHVKYASRHALYPVPNVFDAADDIVVARTCVRAARDVFWTVARFAPRPVAVVTALRAPVAFFETVFRVLRAVCVF